MAIESRPIALSDAWQNCHRRVMIEIVCAAMDQIGCYHERVAGIHMIVINTVAVLDE
jgi:hypothetical protein